MINNDVKWQKIRTQSNSLCIESSQFSLMNHNFVQTQQHQVANYDNFNAFKKQLKKLENRWNYENSGNKENSKK